MFQRLSNVQSFKTTSINVNLLLFLLKDLHKEFPTGCFSCYLVKSKGFSEHISSSHQRCSIKKVFLKISQSSQGNSLQHRCFPVNIGKFLRTPILENICEWLPQTYFTSAAVDIHKPIGFFLYPPKTLENQ